jgi:hypothetical protein
MAWTQSWSRIVSRAQQLRPVIDARVLAFVAEHEFAPSDFPRAGLHLFRLSRDVTQLLLHKASLPGREIEAAAEWMVKTIVKCAGVKIGWRSITLGGRKPPVCSSLLSLRRELPFGCRLTRI